MNTSNIQSVSGLIAVAVGLIAILLLALATVFLLAFKIAAPTDAVVAVATGAFGVIGSVVGAYFGVKVGTDQTKPLTDAAAAAQTKAANVAAAAQARSAAMALHVSPERAREAADAANAAAPLPQA